MITVDAALAQIFALLTRLPAETVPLREGHGRVLAEDAVAARDQPPFDGSAMDGYAVRAADARPGACLRVIGAAPAGRAFAGRLGDGEAVRIFTGAPLPAGSDAVVIQEEVTAAGDTITLGGIASAGHVRPAGADFRAGDRLTAGRRLRPAEIALLASMNVPEIRVTRRPVVAILSTGDELVMPGGAPRDDQIVASNALGLAALVETAGAVARVLPIARDTEESLGDALALAEGADLIVTTGGASVGDHDLMARAGSALGLDRSFYRVAMRPGKPLMAGRLHGTPLIGLPGNPVSTMVCGTIFVRPALDVLSGLPAAPAPRHTALLAHDLDANGPREHYMRAWREGAQVHVARAQDSHLQRILAEADALVVRAPHATALPAGSTVEIVQL